MLSLGSYPSLAADIQNLQSEFWDSASSYRDANPREHRDDSSFAESRSSTLSAAGLNPHTSDLCRWKAHHREITKHTRRRGKLKIVGARTNRKELLATRQMMSKSRMTPSPDPSSCILSQNYHSLMQPRHVTAADKYLQPRAPANPWKHTCWRSLRMARIDPSPDAQSLRVESWCSVRIATVPYDCHCSVTTATWHLHHHIHLNLARWQLPSHKGRMQINPVWMCPVGLSILEIDVRPTEHPTREHSACRAMYHPLHDALLPPTRQ